MEAFVTDIRPNYIMGDTKGERPKFVVGETDGDQLENITQDSQDQTEPEIITLKSQDPPTETITSNSQTHGAGVPEVRPHARGGHHITQPSYHHLLQEGPQRCDPHPVLEKRQEARNYDFIPEISARSANVKPKFVAPMQQPTEGERRLKASLARKLVVLPNQVSALTTRYTSPPRRVGPRRFTGSLGAHCTDDCKHCLKVLALAPALDQDSTRYNVNEPWSTKKKK